MRTLLLADDNITVQRVIALTFAGDKTIQIVTVADGRQAMEKMAAARQCKGGLGAGLVSDKGPVEVYRMACDNGQVFMARCEMRQCAPLK